MLNITIRDPKQGKFYRALVTPAWANRHDNGALISCGLTIDQAYGQLSDKTALSRRSFRSLQRTGAVHEITKEAWNHSSCQSRCVLRGDDICQW